MIFVTFALLVALRDVLHFRGDRKRMRFLADGLLALRAHAFIAVIADALRSDTVRCRYEMKRCIRNSLILGSRGGSIPPRTGAVWYCIVVAPYNGDGSKCFY